MNNAQKVINITVFGAPGVGKTFIVSRFMSHTLQLEIAKSRCDVHQGIFKTNISDVLFLIHDTTNYDDFPAMTEQAFNCSDAFIIVTSLTDENSFKYASKLSEEIRSKRCTVSVIIVGNKSDQRADMSLTEHIIREAVVNMDWGCSYIEASAKTNINILEIFQKIFTNIQPYSKSKNTKHIQKSNKVSTKIKNWFIKKQKMFK